MMAVPDDLIRSDVVLEEAQIGRRTLGHWFERGKLRRYRIAGERRIYVSRAELESVLQPREMKP